MKKWFVGLTASILSTIAVVSAQFGYADFRSASNDIIQWIQDIFGPFLSVLLGVDQFNEYLFARILIAILLFMVIYYSLKKVGVFKQHETITALVAIIVSLLGTRTLTENSMIAGILIPYSTLAVALSVALPFLIFFFFVEESISSGLWRRAMWILFGVTFISIWISRLGEINSTISGIYIAGIIATIIAFTWDGAINRYFDIQKRKGAIQGISDKRYKDLLNELESTGKALSSNPDDTRLIRHYNNLAKQLNKSSYIPKSSGFIGGAGI